MNEVLLVGRLTKDPEVRIMPNSTNKVTNFTLAVNRRFTDANGERKTDFFNLIAFGKQVRLSSQGKHWAFLAPVISRRC